MNPGRVASFHFYPGSQHHWDKGKQHFSKTGGPAAQPPLRPFICPFIPQIHMDRPQKICPYCPPSWGTVTEPRWRGRGFREGRLQGSASLGGSACTLHPGKMRMLMPWLSQLRVVQWQPEDGCGDEGPAVPSNLWQAGKSNSIKDFGTYLRLFIGFTNENPLGSQKK